MNAEATFQNVSNMMHFSNEICAFGRSWKHCTSLVMNYCRCTFEKFYRLLSAHRNFSGEVQNVQLGVVVAHLG